MEPQITIEANTLVKSVFPDPNNILYSCVKLNYLSSVRLQSYIDSNTPGGLLPVIKSHHMTIRFGRHDVSELPIGMPVKMTVSGFAQNKDLQTVKVVPFQEDIGTTSKIRTIFSYPEIPHVTVSHTRQGRPKDSTDLLKNGYLPLNGPTLIGTVGYYLRGRNSNHFYTK